MFLNHIYEHARANPDKLAVINSGQEISYRRFAVSIDALRSILKQADLPPGGIIANIAGNLYNDWLLLIALRSLGHTVVVGASWQVLESLDLPITALASFEGQSEATEPYKRAQPDGRIIEIPRHLKSTQDSGYLPEPIADATFGDHILLTSGTTGTYKKVLFEGEKLEISYENKPGGPAHVSRSASDVYYAFDFGAWTKAGGTQPLSYWYHGATVIFDQRADWAEHFFDFPVNKVSMVPPLLEKLCDTKAVRPAHYPPCIVRTGGGFLNIDVANRAKQKLNCRVLAMYGGTEFHGGMESFVETQDDVVWLAPIWSGQCEIVDEQDQPVPVGTEGILRVKSQPGDPTEYFDDPEVTARHFRDGYFYPGDLAVQREDGRYRILGRMNDVLNMAGRKIAIEPFEAWLRQTLDVPSLCAFVQQDDQGKELMVVVIEGAQLPEQDKLQAAAKGIQDVKEVKFAKLGKFPRGDNGMMKVNRREVLRLAGGTKRKKALAAPVPESVKAAD